MKKVIAALDNSLAGKALLEATRTLAAALDAEVAGPARADRRRRTARGIAEAADISLRTTEGPVVERLVEAGEASDVVALVIGARGSPSDAQSARRHRLGRRHDAAQAGRGRAARRARRRSIPARARPARGSRLELARAALGHRARPGCGARRVVICTFTRRIDPRLHRPATARATGLGGRVPASLLPAGESTRSSSRSGSAGRRGRPGRRRGERTAT